ncbi:uncharacterized protein LOC111065407 [Drosophila obscura]|uniref:uncharacterized protein LOC111065407 n=1 Tax=Drosophila obscura TaxID=7282 RepID=UPI000BA0363B|nr:uncharacterized protein LOC111065407 [Drosophila obscura]
MHSMGFLVALSICLPLLALGWPHAAAEAEAGATPSTVRPKLIIEEAEAEPESEPMRYQLITEHRPMTLGQNYYIKPGQIVGSINLASPSLHVRHGEEEKVGGKPIASKHNILFVAYAKDVHQKSLA